MNPLFVGFVGSALLAWGSCQPSFSHDVRGWPDATVNAIGSVAVEPLDSVLIVIGVALLTWSWWAIRPSVAVNNDLAATRPWQVLVVWSLPLLLVPPVLTGDPVLYADLGWILSRGQNPYVVGLTGAGGPFAAQVDPLWAGSGVAYPPLTLLVDQLIVVGTGAHPYGAIIAMRLPAILGVVLTGWALPSLARTVRADPVQASWLALLNPLTVVHFVGGAHNDALMVGVALLGLRVALAGPQWWYGLVAGPAVIGIAMALKQQSGLAVVAAAGMPVIRQLAGSSIVRRLWLLGWRTGIGVVVAVSTFAAISLASGLGFGWTRWLSLMGQAGTAAPFSIISGLGQRVIVMLGGDPGGFTAVVSVVSSAVVLVTLAWVLVRFADRPLAAVGWGSLAISVLGQSMHPWYIPWSLALVALVPLVRRQRAWLIGFSAVFVIWNAIQTVIWNTAR